MACGMMIDQKSTPGGGNEDSNRNPIPRIPLAELLRGSREAIILHAGQEYRLRITANNRLILTK
jgi:hemin uptake protein HemP